MRALAGPASGCRYIFRHFFCVANSPSACSPRPILTASFSSATACIYSIRLPGPLHVALHQPGQHSGGLLSVEASPSFIKINDSPSRSTPLSSTSMKTAMATATPKLAPSKSVHSSQDLYIPSSRGRVRPSHRRNPLRGSGVPNIDLVLQGQNAVWAWTGANSVVYVNNAAGLCLAVVDGERIREPPW